MFLEALQAAIPLVLLTVGTAAVVGAYVTRRYVLAIGILFLLASMSRFAVDIAGSGVRLEQPAVILIAGVILVRERADLFATVRRAWVPVSFAAVYLAAHFASSALVAPDPAQSLKIAAWFGISITAAGIAAVVAYRAARESLPTLGMWILGAAALHVAVAVVAVGSQVVLDTTWGVQSTDVLIGKAFGLSYEANLFGILLAMALPLALFETAYGPRLRRNRRVALVTWLAIGLGLAYSRGPILAFVVAIGLVIIVLALRSRPADPRRWIRNFGPVAASAFVVLTIAVATIQVQDALARSGARDTGNIVVVGDVPAPPPATRPPPEESPEATPRPSEPVQYVGTSDTIGLRMRHSIQALREFPQSPIIGLGTDSYGQRHTEPGCKCSAHISNLSVATLYESGIVGSVGLVGLLAVTAFATWRLRAWSYTAAVLALIIGFQATDAFRFAPSWIILGTIIGTWAAARAGRATREPPDGSADLSTA